MTPNSASVGGASGNGARLEPLLPPPLLCFVPRRSLALRSSPTRRRASIFSGAGLCLAAGRPLRTARALSDNGCSVDLAQPSHPKRV